MKRQWDHKKKTQGDTKETRRRHKAMDAKRWMTNTLLFLLYKYSRNRVVSTLMFQLFVPFWPAHFDREFSQLLPAFQLWFLWTNLTKCTCCQGNCPHDLPSHVSEFCEPVWPAHFDPEFSKLFHCDLFWIGLYHHHHHYHYCWSLFLSC